MTIHHAYERIIAEQAARIEDLKAALDHERGQSRSLVELLAQGPRTLPSAVQPAPKPAATNPNRTVPLTQPLPAALPPSSSPSLLKRPLREPRRSKGAEKSAETEATSFPPPPRPSPKASNRSKEQTQLLSAEELRAGFAAKGEELSDQEILAEQPEAVAEQSDIERADTGPAALLAIHADLHERAKKRSKTRPAFWQRVRSFLTDETPEETLPMSNSPKDFEQTQEQSERNELTDVIEQVPTTDDILEPLIPVSLENEPVKREHTD